MLQPTPTNVRKLYKRAFQKIKKDSWLANLKKSIQAAIIIILKVSLLMRGRKIKYRFSYQRKNFDNQNSAETTSLIEILCHVVCNDALNEIFAIDFWKKYRNWISSDQVINFTVFLNPATQMKTQPLKGFPNDDWSINCWMMMQ